MKILIVAGEYYGQKAGGIGKHIRDLYLELSKKGHDTTVIASSNQDNPDFRNISYSRIPVYRLFDWSLKVSSYAKQESFDLIHVHMPTGMIYPMVHNSKTPMIITFHSIGAVINNPILRCLETKKDVTCAKKADMIIAVSRTVENMLTKKGISRSKIEYIPNWVPQKKYVRKKKSSVLNILYVGRLEKIKGIQTLIDALKLLKLKYKATIIGDGSLAKELKKTAAGLDIDFKGYINNENLDPYFRKADVFVLPSLSESMPYSLLEAMSYGLPIVASDIQGIRDITDEKFTVFAQPGDPRSFSEAVLKASKNLGSLSIGSFDESKKYSLNIDRTLNLYKRVIDA